MFKSFEKRLLSYIDSKEEKRTIDALRKIRGLSKDERKKENQETANFSALLPFNSALLPLNVEKFSSSHDLSSYHLLPYLNANAHNELLQKNQSLLDWCETNRKYYEEKLTYIKNQLKTNKEDYDTKTKEIEKLQKKIKKEVISIKEEDTSLLKDEAKIKELFANVEVTSSEQNNSRETQHDHSNKKFVEKLKTLSKVFEEVSKRRKEYTDSILESKKEEERSIEQNFLAYSRRLDVALGNWKNLVKEESPKATSELFQALQNYLDHYRGYYPDLMYICSKRKKISEYEEDQLRTENLKKSYQTQKKELEGYLREYDDRERDFEYRKKRISSSLQEIQSKELRKQKEIQSKELRKQKEKDLENAKVEHAFIQSARGIIKAVLQEDQPLPENLSSAEEHRFEPQERPSEAPSSNAVAEKLWSKLDELFPVTADSSGTSYSDYTKKVLKETSILLDSGETGIGKPESSKRNEWSPEVPPLGREPRAEEADPSLGNIVTTAVANGAANAMFTTALKKLLGW